MDDISLSIFDIFQPSLLHVLHICFSANRSYAVFMDTGTHFVVHMEAADSREVERHSPHMGKLLKERGLSFGLVDG